LGTSGEVWIVLTFDKAIIVILFVLVQCLLDACGKLMVKAMVVVCLHYVEVVIASVWGRSSFASSIVLQSGNSCLDVRRLGAIEGPLVSLGLAHAKSRKGVGGWATVAVRPFWVLSHRFNVDPRSVFEIMLGILELCWNVLGVEGNG
jgi:hypothetical protein